MKVDMSVRYRKFKRAWGTFYAYYIHSGNSVSLEQEMVKGGDVNREYSMNTAIVRSFHRMLLSGLKA